MHDVKELTRQFYKAQSKFEAARRNFSDAKTRLHNAAIDEAVKEFAARGMTVGSKVTDGKTIYGFGGFGATTYSTSTRISPGIVLFKIKKDGTVGKQHAAKPWNMKLEDFRPAENEE